MDHYPTGLKHTVPAHKAWVPPAVPPPPASTQTASGVALVPPAPPSAGKATHPSSTSGYDSDRSGPSQASSLTNRSTRTIEECKELIGKLDAAVIQLTSNKADAESARVAAVMDRDAMQQALAANQAVLKATQASVGAMSISNKATEARMATMERMMAQFAAQSGIVGPGPPSGDQMIQPPLIQRTGDVNQALAEEEDEENPMFTTRRSNEHRATVAAGPNGRQALSPSVEPPNKMRKPAEQRTDGDSNMLGTDQACLLYTSPSPRD